MPDGSVVDHGTGRVIEGEEAEGSEHEEAEGGEQDVINGTDCWKKLCLNSPVKKVAVGVLGMLPSSSGNVVENFDIHSGGEVDDNPEEEVAVGVLGMMPSSSGNVVQNSDIHSGGEVDDEIVNLIVDDDSIIIKIITAATTRSPGSFSPFTVEVNLGDDMSCVRRRAWMWCHSASDVPYPEDKLFNATMNVVVDGKVKGKFVEKHNVMTVRSFLYALGLGEAKDDITLVMPLSSESIGGGKRGKPAGGHFEFNHQITQKLSSMLINIQGIATAQVDLNNLKAFFDAMTLLQLDEITKICNSKLNNGYKMESIMLYEPTLSALEEQSTIVEDFVGQFKKRFTDTFTLEDIKEEIIIQKRIRSQAVAMPLG